MTISRFDAYLQIAKHLVFDLRNVSYHMKQAIYLLFSIHVYLPVWSGIPRQLCVKVTDSLNQFLSINLSSFEKARDLFPGTPREKRIRRRKKVNTKQLSSRHIRQWKEIFIFSISSGVISGALCVKWQRPCWALGVLINESARSVSHALGCLCVSSDASDAVLFLTVARVGGHLPSRCTVTTSIIPGVIHLRPLQSRVLTKRFAFKVQSIQLEI